MSTADAADTNAHDDHAHQGPKWLAHHFDEPAQQLDSAKLGMWIFIVTEILMFGGLFAGFIATKQVYPRIFYEAHLQLDRVMGGVNTVVLLFSSLTVALAVRSAQLGNRKKTSLYLLITLLCAAAFLVVKYVEYSHKFHLGLLPGPAFKAHLLPITDPHYLPQKASLFFGLYFMMTGLHGIHVVVGMALISWVLLRNNRGDFSPAFSTPVEIVGLYWHLVDLIWIYLFPLLYLIG